MTRGDRKEKHSCNKCLVVPILDVPSTEVPDYELAKASQKVFGAITNSCIPSSAVAAHMIGTIASTLTHTRQLHPRISPSTRRHPQLPRPHS